MWASLRNKQHFGMASCFELFKSSCTLYLESKRFNSEKLTLVMGSTKSGSCNLSQVDFLVECANLLEESLEPLPEMPRENAPCSMVDQFQLLIPTTRLL